MDTPNDTTPTNTGSPIPPVEPAAMPTAPTPQAEAKPVEELPPALSPNDLNPPPKMSTPAIPVAQPDQVAVEPPQTTAAQTEPPPPPPPAPQPTEPQNEELPPATSPDDLMIPKSPSNTPVKPPSNPEPGIPAAQPGTPPVAPPVPTGFKPPETPGGILAPTLKAPKNAIIKRSGSSSLPKIILGIVVFLIVAGAVFFGFFYRATLNINIPTKPDQILLDQKQIQEGITKIMPGSHTLVISKKGYISYRVSKKFAINEKLKLAFELKPQTVAQVVAPGGKMTTSSSDQKFINFVTADNFLAAIAVSAASAKPAVTQLSVGAFNGLRSALFSSDNTFALVLDAEALKLIDLKKTNILDQVVTKLPPDPSRISSLSWNETASQFVNEPNAKIIYDLKTSDLWNIILANRTHSQSEILMELKSTTFTNLNLNWGQSPKNILVAGGELGVIDVSSRTYQTIDKDKDIHFALWGPNGTYALALAQNNDAYVVKDASRLENLNQKTVATQMTFISEKEGLIVNESRPVRINFDTGEVTSYAEIKGLDGAKSIAVAGGNLYFADQEGLKTAPLTENVYSQ